MWANEPALKRCVDVEKNGMGAVMNFLQNRGWKFVLTGEGSFLSKELQKIAGDLIANDPQGLCRCIEVKVEEKTTGNLFLETWSNESRFTPGWLQYSNADRLFYYFLDQESLHVCDLHKLKRWAFGVDGIYHEKSRISEFPYTRQRKTSQRNETWGHIVPVHILTGEVGLNTYPCPAV